MLISLYGIIFPYVDRFYTHALGGLARGLILVYISLGTWLVLFAFLVCIIVKVMQ